MAWVRMLPRISHSERVTGKQEEIPREELPTIAQLDVNGVPDRRQSQASILSCRCKQRLTSAGCERHFLSSAGQLVTSVSGTVLVCSKSCATMNLCPSGVTSYR